VEVESEEREAASGDAWGPAPEISGVNLTGRVARGLMAELPVVEGYIAADGRSVVGVTS
jgi:hypothetical protein